MTLDRALSETVEELARATRVHGPFASPHEGFAVLLEEVDELWEAVRLRPADPTRRARMREEAAQVAAMAVRFLIDLEDDEEVLR